MIGYERQKRVASKREQFRLRNRAVFTPLEGESGDAILARLTTSVDAVRASPGSAHCRTARVAWTDPS
jgi:hypothetical protein